jgi:hypothetical protein
LLDTAADRLYFTIIQHSNDCYQSHEIPISSNSLIESYSVLEKAVESVAKANGNHSKLNNNNVFIEADECRSSDLINQIQLEKNITQLANITVLPLESNKHNQNDNMRDLEQLEWKEFTLESRFGTAENNPKPSNLQHKIPSTQALISQGSESPNSNSYNSGTEEAFEMCDERSTIKMKEIESMNDNLSKYGNGSIVSGSSVSDEFEFQIPQLPMNHRKTSLTPAKRLNSSMDPSTTNSSQYTRIAPSPAVIPFSLTSYNSLMNSPHSSLNSNALISNDKIVRIPSSKPLKHNCTPSWFGTNRAATAIPLSNKPLSSNLS